MQKRTAALIAGASAAVAMTITGVTYASADASQSAPAAREAVRPASAPLGGDSHWDHKKDHGSIQINERLYSEDPGACVTVTNLDALGNGTFNITNDTDRVVEFFNGVNCNSGNPAAVVLPGDSRFGVAVAPPGAGSFRVIDN
ncbi:hypothetical protein [Streptomyces coerulescens]|uniref:Secreted protein n=1 Tax=Streptomyces coerulescens TaxID=29304 RepID=A0ABW0CXL1_STRCD